MESLIFTHRPFEKLKELLSNLSYDGVVFEASERVAPFVNEVLFEAQEQGASFVDTYSEFSLCDLINPLNRFHFHPDGESFKSLSSLEKIWREMLNAGLTRRSIMVVVGGGTFSDLMGMASALYMRGIKYITIPTTLLAMVDASLGGKTAVNFEGVKNLIGAFHSPVATIVDTRFLKSLPPHEILSGYGEMLKHALLSGWEVTRKYLEIDPQSLNASQWEELVKESVQVKQRIVEADPKETGLRKILNLGHTVGHAFESLAIAKDRPVSHGIAVAQGIVTALVLSVMVEGYDTSHMQRVIRYMRDTFPFMPFGCGDYPKLLCLMSHDKKNEQKEKFSFTLLDATGQPVHSRLISEAQVKEALDITRDLLGI